MSAGVSCSFVLALASVRALRAVDSFKCTSHEADLISTSDILLGRVLLLARIILDQALRKRQRDTVISMAKTTTVPALRKPAGQPSTHTSCPMLLQRLRSSASTWR